jgi:hypothetical protein
MPIDVDKANSNKETILATLSAKGPSLPVHLAQAIQLSPLFASAFLSELYSEGKLKISNMKVGSSPLYYLPTQEHMLENFVNFLNAREKEALHLLKRDKILDDELQSPVIRVALRAIKDFAIPLKITHEGKEKLYWKYFLVQDSELRDLIEKPRKKQERQIPLEQKNNLEHKTMIQEKPSLEEKKIEEQVEKEVKKIEEAKEEPLTAIEKPKKTKKTPESKFVANLKEYLSAKEIEILETFEEKKKEFYAKIRVDSIFGKQEYYLVSKDKKKLSETDLVFALQKAQEMKMPALLMAPGELDKKAHEYHKSWKNLIKLEKVKL